MTLGEQIPKINKNLSLVPVMLLTGLPASRLHESSALSRGLQRCGCVVRLPGPSTEQIQDLTLNTFPNDMLMPVYAAFI